MGEIRDRWLAKKKAEYFQQAGNGAKTGYAGANGTTPISPVPVTAKAAITPVTPATKTKTSGIMDLFKSGIGDADVDFGTVYAPISTPKTNSRVENTLSAGVKQWASGMGKTGSSLFDTSGAEQAGDDLDAIFGTGTGNKIHPVKAAVKVNTAISDKAGKYADEQSKSASEYDTAARQGLGTFGNLLVSAGESGTQMLLDFGATGGKGTLASMGTRSFGSHLQEAEATGASKDDATNYAIGASAIDVLTEKISSIAAPFTKMFGKGVLDGLSDRLIDLAKTQTGRAALKTILSSGGEGLEEVIADALNPVVRQQTINKGASYGELFDTKQAVQDGLVGAIMGLAGGATEIPGAIKSDVDTSKSTGYASFKPMTEAEQAAHDKVLALNPQPAKQTAPDIVKILAGTNVQPETTEQATTQDNPQSVITPPQEQNAPTAKQDAPTEIVQPVQPEVAQQASSAAAVAEKPTGPHIDERSYSDVSSRKVKAFQYDHPELHPYFVEAAKGLQQMLGSSTKGERFSVRDEDGYVTGSTGASRNVTPEIEKLLDNAGLSYAQIGKALDDLIHDHGQENYAAAKKVELALDDMLTSGFEIEGYDVPANTEYINAKNALRGNGGLDGYSMSEEEWNSLMAQGDGLGAADKGFTGEPTPFDVWSDNTPANQMHPVGENPTRAVDLPKVNPQGENTMATGRTVMEAEATPNSRIPEIQQYMVDGNLSYVPVENSTLAEDATKEIEHSGWEVAHTKWVKAVSSGKTSPELVAMGATLLNTAGNTSTVSAGEYLDLLTDYSELLHRSGQALQAARILKTLSPEGRLYAIQRSVESMVEEMKNGQDITINPNLIDAYREAQSDEARDYALSNIEQNIADQTPSTLLDKWTALRYVNMLGNFKTQARNIVGNAVMGVTAKAKNELRAGIEHLASAVTGGKYERTTSMFVSTELRKAAREDFNKVRDAALGESKYMDAPGSTQIQRSINDKRQIFSIPVLEAYRKATNWAMEHGDVIFSRATYADTLAGYLKAHGYTAEQLSNGSIPTEALDKARMFAIKEAQEATFRDTNAVSKAVSSIGRGPNAGKVTKVISEGIQPFRKTPANVAVRGEEYSLLGVANTVVKTVQAVKGRGNATGNDVINSLSKTLTGSSLFYLGWALAKSGLLRGKDDDEGREAFDKLNGHQDYSLELPDGTSYTMDWMTPAAMPIFMGAQLFNVSDENGIDLKAIESALSSIGDPLIEMSMLSGVNDALGNIKRSGNHLVQFLANASVSYLTQGLTNSLLGQAERTAETTRQQTYVDKNSEMPDWLQRALGKASAKTPGVDYDQTDYIDAWGRTQSTGDVSQRIFQNFFSPGYISTVKDGSVSSELQRLYDAGQTNVLPQIAQTSTDVNGKKLSGDEYAQYQTAKGKTSYDILKSIIADSSYKSMSDEEKANVVSDAYSYSNAVAAKAVADKRGDGYSSETWDKYITAEKEQGIDWWTYYQFRHPEDVDNSGTKTNADYYAAIKSLAGLSNSQKNYMRKVVKGK